MLNLPIEVTQWLIPTLMANRKGQQNDGYPICKISPVNMYSEPKARIQSHLEDDNKN